MRIFITGGTGFIGRALVPVLQRDGHTVVVWSRSEQRARARLGADIEVVRATDAPDDLVSAVATCDAVVNLAGEPILGGRWTHRRRQILTASRVGVTDRLVQAMARSTRRPGVFVSGSAVGYYGDRGTEPLTEASAPGQGFLADLARAWEDAARKATALGVRVVQVRTGVVLGRDGGALAQMLPPFRLGLGGPVGTGRQGFPWIHLHDLVRIIAATLSDNRYVGAINAVAPESIDNRAFARALGRTLRRPAVLPVPAVALHAMCGEASTTLLSSQFVLPAALQSLGFSFAFPTVQTALTDIVGGVDVQVRSVEDTTSAGRSATGRRYLETRRPTHELVVTTRLASPVDQAFPFFSKAENLGLLTPASMGFSITGGPPAIGEDAAIEYRLRVGGVPIAWRSRIVNWTPGERFVDFQETGPYRSWWHEHSFRRDGTSTVMEDRVRYAPPLGPLGRLANRLFIAPMLRRIFQYRADVIRLRFGAA